MLQPRVRLLLSLSLIAAGVAVAVGASIWARPLFALQDLKVALEARDEQRVAADVDFVALKANVTAYVDQRIAKSNEGKFLGGVRTALSQPLADFKIERLASPSGLIHLACDTQADGSVDDSPQPPGTPCKFDADLHGMHYRADGSFAVMASRPQQDDMGMILRRGDDGRWRLIGLTGGGPVAK